ncbi:hypothetical protein H2O64_20940 [Kordia sp. YSTF-M3]|uniref:Uncharacterized protein n=1 Tax=Kordia aestuariivivens TaxID=2759037 RepID=A0ABR7QF35_9FLAO|nr:hypothetical protein [Kordia aestuariivivens]MBC8757149.1 hypothetical protein [Kordia aestuariivivens]
MKEILFQQAFKKAKQQSGKTSKNGVSSHLENVFAMKLNFQTSKVTFSRYYEQFMEGKTGKIMNPSTGLLDKLAEYIGYNSYEDFVTQLDQKDTPTRVSFLKFARKSKWFIIITLLALVTVFIIIKLNKQRWMVWNLTHYEEVQFDLEKYELGQLKLYKEERIKNFKKIEVDCQTEYKTPEGTIKIWYGKNHKKELQYFTSLGLHPETGNSLKPLSKYMFEEHICIKESSNSNKN